MRYPVCLLFVWLLFSAAPVSAGWVEETIRYSKEETEFSGVLVYHDSVESAKPGIFMVPNWMGVTDAAVRKAKKIAGREYVVFVADMYGRDVRPANSEEAGEAAGFVREDRELMRRRARLGLDTFLREASDAPLDTRKTAAIGFCFGGGTVLEFARGGAALDAVVSFHGDLASPTLEPDAADTRAKVLVLHGADDPYVPQEDVERFIAAMRETEVDWQLLQFGNAVHSFTNPSASQEGKAEYDERAAGRAFRQMNLLFDSVWEE